MPSLRTKTAIVMLCAIISISCDFADLRPIGMSIEPDKPDSLLAEAFTPVKLRFDTEMKKNDTEGILQVSSDTGVVTGDKFWDGNALYFVPVAGWTAGIRYSLSLSGMLQTVDGREQKVERFIPFYAINRNNPPALKLFSPGEGESTGTNDIIIELHFSRSMNRLTTESALTFEGISGKTFEWLADDTILKVIPDKALSPWSQYRWSLKESAKSRDGAPLPKAYSGQFFTNLDQTLPKVQRVFPVLNSDGGWFPTGANIETGLRFGNGIGVEFNKVMSENVIRSLRFEPSLSGRAEYLSEKSIVYIFSKNPEPATAYTLIISGDTKDSEGLKIGEDYRINFVPDIPLLKIFSIYINGDYVIDDFSSNNLLTVSVDPAVKKLEFIINFSLRFGEEEKRNTPLKISINSFFPRTIDPAALEYVYWISDYCLKIDWEGFDAGSNDTPHYYKLIIPGGRSGISSSEGIYMNEDISVLLEVINE